jgi:hypothetical protein
MKVNVALILSTSFGAIGAKNSVSQSSMRRLQVVQPLPQTLNYRASYSADFQYFSDVLCDGPEPLLAVNCFGKNMTILNTSDPTINCTLLAAPLVENGTSYECKNSCVDTACLSVYRYKSEFFNPLDGSFGSVSFMCEGDTLD